MAKKYIDAEGLRKEVKRLEKIAHKFALGCADSETRKFHEGKDFAYQHVGILINSLQQEQPSEELTTEVEKYFQGLWPGMETAEQCNTDMHFTPPAIMRLANHFANWQKEQMIRDCSVQASYEAEIEKAEERGYNLCKEQMLKDAVEGFIYQTADYYPKQLIAGYDGELGMGDKVKIVIIPEKED